MTLEEFAANVSEASQKAHLFIADSGEPVPVRSVSVRIDDDGVVSIILHDRYLRNRMKQTPASRETGAPSQQEQP